MQNGAKKNGFTGLKKEFAVGHVESDGYLANACNNIQLFTTVNYGELVPRNYVSTS